MNISREGLFAYFGKATAKRYKDIIRVFGSLDACWDNRTQKVFKQVGWKDDLIAEFVQWKNALDVAAIEQELVKESIHVVAITDKEYPPLLKQIHDPPFALFVRGSLPPSHLPLIAIVGSRLMSTYGNTVTQQIARELVLAPVGIVSGLARGIDGSAHAATLAAKGYTMAVLGGGIDDASITPRQNRNLAHDILSSGGCIVSEYPPKTVPNKYTFPARNRIIAGLCRATIIIEAKEKSGALITADFALNENREVFAVPQNITSPTAAGTNMLIKNGAIPLTKTDDIFEALNLQKINQHDTTSPNTTVLTSLDTQILACLSQEPVVLDYIIREVAQPASTITSAITLLELSGHIKHVGNKLYIRTLV